MKDRFQDFLAALRSADRVVAKRLISDALAQAIAPEQLLNEVVIAGLNALGEGWEDGSVSLTQVYMGGRIVDEVVESLLPRFGSHPQTWGKIVIGTLGDHHGLGQRIVGSYLASAGAEVVSLGLGVKPSVFVERAIAEHADLVAISVLMYHSALEVRRIREMLEERNHPIPLLVGGAPFSQDRTLWQQVGASAMGSNPAEGIAAARHLIGER